MYTKIPKGVGGRLAPRKVAVALRRQQAIQMRVTGYTLTEIAQALGYGTPSAVHAAIDRGLTLTRQADVEQLRDVEGRRLDSISKVLWPQVLAANIQAIETYLKVMARRARMFGLDLTLPPTTEIKGGIVLVKVGEQEPRRLEELVDDELSAYLTELRSVHAPNTDNEDTTPGIVEGEAIEMGQEAASR